MRKLKSVIVSFTTLVILFSLFSTPVFAGPTQPGDSPLALAGSPAGSTPQVSTPAAPIPSRYHINIPLLSRGPDLISADKLDMASRQTVLSFYQQHYLAYTGTPIQWTGSQAACSPGATSAAFQQAVLERINYFRAMAGVPANISLSADFNRKAQSAALMMSAAGQLSHSPPSSWPCYSADGASAAGSSDLYLGEYSWNAISGYMRDIGSGNAAAGHRRWLLYPQTLTMGSGDIPSSTQYYSANSLVVLDGHAADPRPATRNVFVAWPPPGYVPAPVVFARWSFSYPQADFSAASVKMASNGASLPVSLAAVENGYGENTLVWIPLGLSDSADWPKISADTTYSVTVSNVLINGASRSFSYNVIVFNP